ncbi:MAG: hypothetical protein NW215_05540 [Hyphomicrobiales bacterium]|nr:hypothetical protein [Hyphomicrobiales bacterium]
MMSVHRPDGDALAAQLASLAAQTHPVAALHVRVDGDGPPDDVFARSGLSVTVERGPRLGVLGGFIAALSRALQRAEPCAAFAFCDQDDVWEPQKLAAQAGAMRKGAALCLSDASVIDRGGRMLAGSLFALEGRRPPRDFADLLIRNTASGNGMMFSRAAAELACSMVPAAAPDQHALLHDWWVALCASALGPVAFLNQPLLRYRRHAGNVIGPAPVARPSRRLWGAGAMSAEFRAKCETHYALRAYLLAALLAPGGDRVRGALPLYRDPGLAAFAAPYGSAALRGDRAARQSLWMSALGKAQLKRAGGEHDAECARLALARLGRDA